MRIGILEAGPMPASLANYGTIADLFAQLLDPTSQDYEFERYAVIDNDFPTDVTSCEGYLITGSIHGAYENLPWINRLKQFVVEINKVDLPLVGVCFGHQLIAEALGGKVEKYSGGWGVGRQKYQFLKTNHGPCCEQPSLTINAFHQDQITRLPEGAEVFASSKFCQYAGVVYGKNILTVQAHPEFTIEFEAELTKLPSSDVVPKAIRDAVMADLTSGTATIDSQHVGHMIRNLFNTYR